MILWSMIRRTCKRLALMKICYVFLSLTSGKRCTAGIRDTAFPMYTNRLQTTDYLPHVARGRLRGNRMGIHKFLQSYKEKSSIKRRPGLG